MSRAMPSLIALLGVLAVAGYQNRDKLAEMLQAPGGSTSGPDDGSPRPNGSAGGLSGLKDILGGDPATMLRDGFGTLLDRFRQNGQGDTAESWVSTGPNRGLRTDEVEAAVGAENLAELARRTGLSREDLLARLATNIPGAVDDYTPEGRLPAGDDATPPSRAMP